MEEMQWWWIQIADNSSRQGDFPGGPVTKNPPARVEDTSLILGWEIPQCRRATKPMCHNYWAHSLEPMSHNKRNHHKEKPYLQGRVAPTHHN